MGTPPVRGPRERLLRSAVALVREHGVEGTGTAELLAHSGTARASIYQHFPGGKEELVAEATRQAGAFMSRRLRGAAALHDPAAIVTTIVDNAKHGLVAHDYALGCPVVAAATAGPEHAAAVGAAAEVLAAWGDDLAAVFTDVGIEPDRAGSFASLVVSAVEGALLRARASRSVQPLDDVADQLTALARQLLQRNE